MRVDSGAFDILSLSRARFIRSFDALRKNKDEEKEEEGEERLDFSSGG